MSNLGKPILVSKVGGSVTTYNNINPSWGVMKLDAETMLPLNIYTYYLDVTEANATGEAKWELLHDMLETYDMKDLSPSSYLDLAERMRTDMELSRLFEWNKSR